MEHGSTKHIASKACALSLIRQLYHYNLVEAYTGERKKKELPKVSLIFLILFSCHILKQKLTQSNRRQHSRLKSAMSSDQN